MKINRISLVSACLLALFATPALAEFKHIRTEAQLQPLIGKKMYDSSGNWFRWNADGSMSAQMTSGAPFAGAWKWSNGFVCRNARIGDNELGTDCQKIEFDGKNMRYTRNRGRGEASVMALQ
ncbi:hypothetical protein [Lacimonas salitolerans]|uniref:DUF995 domain-containing protein n=1 Tax=Lacimonas salitolerans TaxID=1323750 RepID=A0ABW4EEY4_9RHOB